MVTVKSISGSVLLNIILSSDQRKAFVFLFIKSRTKLSKSYITHGTVNSGLPWRTGPKRMGIY